MRKGILIGAVAGLLVLVFAGGWVAGSGKTAFMPVVPPFTNTPSAKTAPDVQLGRAQPDVAASTHSTASESAVSALAAMNTKERRMRLTEVRKRLAALSAQGANASPAEVNAVITELETLTRGDLDPRYFQSLRSLMENTGKIQALNREAQGISASKAPKDLARQQVIRDELTRLAAAMSAEATKLQSYARRSTPAGATP